MRRGDPKLIKMQKAWDEKWGKTPPIASLLRTTNEERWLRIHTLPDSKRVPSSSAEAETVLRRHRSILSELAVTEELIVICVRFEGESAPQSIDHRVWEYWQTIEDDDHFAEPAYLYTALLEPSSPALAQVLSLAAIDELPGTIIAPVDLGWLYHPYDGGADIIAPTTLERDRLRRQFEAWLSPEPSGL